MRNDRKIHYFKKEKEILALIRRQNELYKIKYNAHKKNNLIKLDKPRRDGFVRISVLRKDIARSKEGYKLQKLLDIINIPQYCDNRKFLVDKRWLNSRIYFPENYKYTIHKKEKDLVELPVKFKEFSEEEFNRKIPEDLKKYFNFDIIVNKWNGSTYKRYFVYPTYKFTTKVKQHWITHVYPLYNEIESEITLLNQKLWIENEAIIWTDKFQRHYEDGYDDMKKRKIEKILDKEMKLEIEEYIK